MCYNQITHWYYQKCQRGQNGGAYHHHPSFYFEECGKPVCEGVSLYDNHESPIIIWAPGDCSICENQSSSTKWWQLSGIEGYRIPREPRLGDIFGVPGAPSRIRSVHSSRTGSPLRKFRVPSPSPSVQSTSSERHRRGSHQSNSGAPGQRSSSRASSIRTSASQSSFGSSFLAQFPQSEMDEHLAAQGVEDIEAYLFGGLETLQENITYAPSTVYNGSTQSQQPGTQSRSAQQVPRTSPQSYEVNLPGTQSQGPGAVTPKTHSGSTWTTSGPQYSQAVMLNGQPESSRGSKASTEPSKNHSQLLDSAWKSLRSGKRY